MAERHEPRYPARVVQRAHLGPRPTDRVGMVAGADDHAIALRITQSADSDALVLTRREARQAAERRGLELEAALKRRS